MYLFVLIIISSWLFTFGLLISFLFTSFLSISLILLLAKGMPIFVTVISFDKIFFICVGCSSSLFLLISKLVIIGTSEGITCL